MFESGGRQVIKRFKKIGTQLDSGEILEECSFVSVLDGVSR